MKLSNEATPSTQGRVRLAAILTATLLVICAVVVSSRSSTPVINSKPMDTKIAISQENGHKPPQRIIVSSACEKMCYSIMILLGNSPSQSVAKCKSKVNCAPEQGSEGPENFKQCNGICKSQCRRLSPSNPTSACNGACAKICPASKPSQKRIQWKKAPPGKEIEEGVTQVLDTSTTTVIIRVCAETCAATLCCSRSTFRNSEFGESMGLYKSGNCFITGADLWFWESGGGYYYHRWSSGGCVYGTYRMELEINGHNDIADFDYVTGQPIHGITFRDGPWDNQYFSRY